MSTTTIQFNSLREKNTFDEGIRLVKAKIEAGKKAKIEAHNLKAQKNREAVIRRMGSQLAAKCFGVKPSVPAVTTPAKVTKTSSSTSNRKSLSAIDEPAWPRATRFLSVSAGTGSPRSTHKIYSGNGLFGR